MESFINLMADDVWSEADIKSRLHAEIRSEVSEMAEQELNRALQGKVFGMHVMSQAEVALLTAFKAATDRTAVLGALARAEMALLLEAMALEAAIKAYAFDGTFQTLMGSFSVAAQDLTLLRGRVSLEEPVQPEPEAPVGEEVIA